MEIDRERPWARYSPAAIARTARRRLSIALRGFRPSIPLDTDLARLRRDLGRFFDLGVEVVEARFEAYRTLHRSRGYAATMGEQRTLCFPEAFACYLALSVARPRSIVEVGTQYGNSTRRLIDMVAELELDSRIVCIDVEDRVRYFERHEAEILLADVTNRFRRAVLETYRPGFVYLDAHPFSLLSEVLREMLDYEPDCILAIHDCGRGLCNPKMTIAKDDPAAITSKTGHWERHVLAEVFGVRKPLSRKLDRLQTATHRLRVLDTPHGIALLRRR